MILPPFLKKGSKVALAAPARKVSIEELTQAIDFISSFELEVMLEENLFLEHNQLAGNELQRAELFQQLIDSNEIAAIFCVRGGYGTSRMIDLLNFEILKYHPKWIIGFSDITVLLNQLYVNQICSLHASMPLWYLKDGATESNKSLFDFLLGKNTLFNSVPPTNLNIFGRAKGKLIGGNLSVFVHLIGSESFPDASGCILFLEDLDEYLYHIDRMLIQLLRAGVFSKIAGLVVGQFSDMKDNVIPWGKNAQEIIFEHASKFNFPVLFNFPAGHDVNNFPLLIGGTYQLEVSSKNCSLQLL